MNYDIYYEIKQYAGREVADDYERECLYDLLISKERQESENENN